MDDEQETESRILGEGNTTRRTGEFGSVTIHEQDVRGC